jgi:hypothetical protein
MVVEVFLHWEAWDWVTTVMVLSKIINPNIPHPLGDHPYPGIDWATFLSRECLK